MNRSQIGRGRMLAALFLLFLPECACFWRSGYRVGLLSMALASCWRRPLKVLLWETRHDDRIENPIH